jgi:hypothetical protein
LLPYLAFPFHKFRQLSNGRSALSSSCTSYREYLTRRQLVEFLAERGFPISESTLNKLAMPSCGEGPPQAGVWGGKAFYAPTKALEWARARFSANELRRSRRQRHD